MSDAIDYAYGYTGDEFTISDSYEEAITRYAESVKRVPSDTQLKYMYEKYENPELLVPVKIPPSAVVEVFSLKTIKRS